MKKRDWISLLLIVVCLCVLFGYREMLHRKQDYQIPEITVEEQMPEFSALDPRSALLAGVTAWDDRDGDVTASLVVESVRLLDSEGIVNVTYAAFDKAGNVAKLSREVRYHDYENPKFSLKRPLMFTQNAKNEVLNAITAWDMLDGDITHRIRATALESVDSNFTGIYKTRFQVTNSLGDTVELVLPVEVYMPHPNEGKLTLTDYLIYLDMGDSFNSRSYLNELTIGKEEISLSGTLPENVKLTVSGKVQTDEPGVYQIDYQIDYYPNLEKPEMKNTAYSRLIVVVEG